MRRWFSSNLLCLTWRRNAITRYNFSPHLASPWSERFLFSWSGMPRPRPAPLFSMGPLEHPYLTRQQCCFISGTQSVVIQSPSWSDDETSDSSSTKAQNATVMEVEMTSRENIKPSSPTPLHLRTYKLSVLDQLFPHIYVPLVFFYPNNQTTLLSDLIRQRSQHLKQSLSETLTRFYPFAGKIKDDLHIHCNDDGVYYVETRIKNTLSNFLDQPNNQLLHKLLPYDPNSMDSMSSNYVVMVQVNIFDCGGIAISMCTSHKIIDGHTYITFFNAWAATARGSCAPIYPSFVAPSFFPQNPSMPKDASLVMWTSIFKKGKCATRRFVFDATALAALKAKTLVQNPSRVLAVTTLIWKCATAASTTTNGSKRPSVLSIAVNLRRKSSPPLSQYSIGNIIWSAVAQCTSKTALKLDFLADQLKNGIAKIDNNFVEGIKGEEGCVKVNEHLKKLGEVYSNTGADYYAVTSVCNAGVYEADFGWGKPVWSCIGNGSAGIPVLTNLIFLMDTKSGDGVEAWVTLSEQDMTVFERDPELLSFSSLDPGPLKLGDPVSHALN